MQRCSLPNKYEHNRGIERQRERGQGEKVEAQGEIKKTMETNNKWMNRRILEGKKKEKKKEEAWREKTRGKVKLRRGTVEFLSKL